MQTLNPSSVLPDVTLRTQNEGARGWECADCCAQRTHLDVLVAERAQFLLLEAGLVEVVDVHLLGEDGQGRLGRLAHLLVHALGLQRQHNGVFKLAAKSNEKVSGFHSPFIPVADSVQHGPVGTVWFCHWVFCATFHKICRSSQNGTQCGCVPMVTVLTSLKSTEESLHMAAMVASSMSPS